MAVEVYAEPFCRRHFAGRLSGASLFRLIGFLGNVVLAFVIAYSTGDFWQRTSTYQEQPRVTFTNDALVVFQGAIPGDERVWSSYPALNAALGAKLVPADISVVQRDLNYDGKNDVIDVSITAHGLSDVLGVQIALQVQYDFSRYLHVQMKGLAFTQYAAGSQGSSLYVDGMLRWRQLEPLKDSGVRSQYDTPALADPSRGAAPLALRDVLAAYMDRNETTIYTDQQQIWTSGPSTAFKAQLRLRIPPQETLTVRPHIFQILKFGWIQFLATYVILWYLFSKLEWVVFHFRLVGTHVRSDIERKEHTF